MRGQTDYFLLLCETNNSPRAKHFSRADTNRAGAYQHYKIQTGNCVNCPSSIILFYKEDPEKSHPQYYIPSSGQSVSDGVGLFCSWVPPLVPLYQD